LFGEPIIPFMNPVWANNQRIFLYADLCQFHLPFGSKWLLGVQAETLPRKTEMSWVTSRQP
jgi:hypothetical protein